MIPPIIHYCWFGNKKKSKLIKKCIRSWKKNCPNYIIQEWNELNFNINCCDYVKEAYQSKKWAFVSDYARHWILNEFGGIYLDTDVELLKPLDNYLTTPLLAFEKTDSINTGLIMICKHNNDYCKYMISLYNNEKFLLQGNKYNTITVCKRTTDYFLNKGLVCDNTLQFVDGFTIYPTEYFCPVNYLTGERNITEKTVAIHHYTDSWNTPLIRAKKKIIKLLGDNITKKIVALKNKIKK